MTSIDPRILPAVSEFVRLWTGLYFPEEKHQDLIRIINTSFKDYGFTDPRSLAEWICSETANDDKIDFIAKNMTVGETYFFRDRNMFDALYEVILPQVIEEKRGFTNNIKIWSAACSTGEEAYTLSIILSESIKNINNGDITVYATDINRNSLSKAMEGVYSEWSIRDNLPEYSKKYLCRINTKSFSVIPEIKSRIKFEYLNFIEDTYTSPYNIKGAMDIILCKNVLMYFNEETRNNIIQKLYFSLADNGWIFFSPCDLSHEINNLFYPVNLNGTILYRKNGKQATGIRQQAAVQEQAIGIRQQAAVQKQAIGIRQQATGSSSRAGKRQRTSNRQQTTGNEQAIGTRQQSAAQVQKREREETTDSRRDRLYEDSLLLFRQGKYQIVLTNLLKFTEANPSYFRNEDSGDIAVLICRSYINTGAFDKAKHFCNNILAMQKMNPDIYYLYATLLKEENKITESIDFLKKSLYLDKNYFLADFTLGVIYKKLGKTQEANRHFANAGIFLGKINDNDIINNTDGLNAGYFKNLLPSLSNNNHNNG